MSRYTHQVVVCIGSTNALKGVQSLGTKWSKINKRPAENHSVVQALKDDHFLRSTKLIDSQSTRFYVLGHGGKNNDLIVGNPRIAAERVSSQELAKQISQLIDQTKIGTAQSPLKINLIMCLGGYSQKPKKSFAENLIHALLNYGIYAEVTARESIVTVDPATGRKNTLKNNARDNFLRFANPITGSLARRTQFTYENLEPSVKSRYVATKNEDFTYAVSHEKINNKPKSAKNSDELLLILNSILKIYKDRAPDRDDVKGRLYCFFRTNPSKESLTLYAALNNLARTVEKNALPEKFSALLNEHVPKLKPNSRLRQLLFKVCLIDKNGNVFEISSAASPAPTFSV